MLHDDTVIGSSPVRSGRDPLHAAVLGHARAHATRALLVGLLLAWALALAAVLPAHAGTAGAPVPHDASGAGAIHLSATSAPTVAPPRIDATGTPTPSPTPAPSGSGSGSSGDPTMRGILFMLLFAGIGWLGLRFIERRMLRG